MSDNTTLKTHIKTDPNAKYHMLVGACTSLVSAGFLIVSDHVSEHILLFALSSVVVPAFIVGIAIEVVQRVDRSIRMTAQNTLRESFMDTCTTGLWVFAAFVLLFS